MTPNPRNMPTTKAIRAPQSCAYDHQKTKDTFPLEARKRERGSIRSAAPDHNKIDKLFIETCKMWEQGKCQ
jgi:hypothetical protein